MKNPPKYYKQTQTCCGKKLKWFNCCRPGGDGCPDCLGAGGWWIECSFCGRQPWREEDLLFPENNWFVYIVRCSDMTFYTGFTNSLEKRLSIHNKGKGSKYTRSRLPVKLVHSEGFFTKSGAMKREYKIKQLTRKEKENLIYGRIGRT